MTAVLWRRVGRRVGTVYILYCTQYVLYTVWQFSSCDIMLSIIPKYDTWTNPTVLSVTVRLFSYCYLCSPFNTVQYDTLQCCTVQYLGLTLFTVQCFSVVFWTSFVLTPRTVLYCQHIYRILFKWRGIYCTVHWIYNCPTVGQEQFLFFVPIVWDAVRCCHRKTTRVPSVIQSLLLCVHAKNTHPTWKPTATNPINIWVCCSPAAAADICIIELVCM